MNWAVLYYVSEWIIRLGMLVYVPQRRSPSAARAWLLLIFIFPWPGLIFYAILGRIRMPMRKVELQAEFSSLIRSAHDRWSTFTLDDSSRLPGEWSQTAALAENLGDFGLCEGNRFELLTSYQRTIDRLLGDIENARHHVHLLYYIYADDQTGRRMTDALCAAAGRGVQCRVLLDAIGSRPALRKLAPSMRAAGIEVVPLMPVRLSRRRSARIDLRNHRKIAVIDGEAGYFGSQNIVDAEFLKGCSNEELVARVEGPVVAQLQAVLLMDRYMETEAGLRGPDLFPDLQRRGGSLAQVLPSGPSYPHENAHQIMIALIYAARQRVVITTPYFIPDEPLLLAMQTAAQRGAEIHLVVSERSNKRMVDLAQKSFYDELLGAGISIHLYRGHFLHAKHMSMDDDVALIGSSNMDIRSFALNSELSVLIYDASVVACLREIQEHYLAHSDLLDPQEWARRPLRAKVVQNVARMADSLL